MKLFARTPKVDTAAVKVAKDNFDQTLDTLLEAVRVNRDVVAAAAAKDPYLKEMLINSWYREELSVPQDSLGSPVDVDQAERSLVEAAAAAKRAGKELAFVVCGADESDESLKVKYKVDSEKRRNYELVDNFVHGSISLSEKKKMAEFAKSLELTAPEAAALQGDGVRNEYGVRATLLEVDGEPVIFVKTYEHGQGFTPGYFTGEKATDIVNSWRDDGSLGAEVSRNASRLAARSISTSHRPVKSEGQGQDR